MTPPIVWVIDPNYYKHIHGLIHAYREKHYYDMNLCSRVLASTNTVFRAVCEHQQKKGKKQFMHIMHRMTYIKENWSDEPHTEGILGWLPFVSVLTCSIVLKNDARISMNFESGEKHTLKTGEFIVYNYDTSIYNETASRVKDCHTWKSGLVKDCPGQCSGLVKGEYMMLNVHYMFIPKWLPVSIFRIYKWLYENTVCLQSTFGWIYLYGLFVCNCTIITKFRTFCRQWI